jgi:hypothetical protein
MNEVKVLFTDLWGFLVSLWLSMRNHSKGFTLLLLLFCFLMLGMHFSFWLIVAYVLLLMLGIFVRELLPFISELQQKIGIYALLVLVVITGLYATIMILGWFVAILVLVALIYFGFLVK